jgi:RNA ligase
MNPHETNKPLSRDEFRNAVFQRDGHKCVMCGKAAQDSHHIIERRLWDDGGYHLANGASLCGPCHIEAEATIISVEDIREKAGITQILVPEHLYPDQPYDKWGNPLLPNGTRVRGELFQDESVRKILDAYGMLSLFTNRVKYPRTYHLPWSQSVNDDDRVLTDLSSLQQAKEVVISTKMDGECTSLYYDYTHARSVDSSNHPSRNRVKGFWGTFAHEIPVDWRICGENLYARHSIAYDNLPHYFLGFSIWNEKNICLGWDETLEWFELLGITPVPVIYRGPFDEKTIKKLWDPKEANEKEGYVVRDAETIGYGEFRKKVAKFVREGHVQTTKHWMRGQPIVQNGLAT